MGQEVSLWEKCVEYHGHVCVGLARGYKAIVTALEELGVSNPKQEDLLIIIENKGCGFDAATVLTGCTIGRGNLVFKDHGKQVYIVGNRKTGQAVRIAMKYLAENKHTMALRSRVIRGEATPEESKALADHNRVTAQQILNLPPDQIGKIEKIQIAFPEKGVFVDTVVCPRCGEGVSSARMKEKDGIMVCLTCAEE